MNVQPAGAKHLATRRPPRQSGESCPFTGESYVPQSDSGCPYLKAKQRVEKMAALANRDHPSANALVSSAAEAAETTALAALPAPSLKAAAQGLDLQFRRRGRGLAFWRKTWKDTSPSKAIELAARNKPFDVRSPGSEWSSLSSLDELKMLVEEAEREARSEAHLASASSAASQVASSLSGVPLELAAPKKLGLLPFARGMVRHYDNPAGFLQEFHAKHGRSFEVKTPTHGDFLFDTRPEVLMEALTQTDFNDNTWKKSKLQTHGASFLIGKTNMFASGGDDWRAIRDAMQPHFKAKNLRSPEMMARLATIFDDHLKELKARVAAAPNGELTINVRDEMQTAVLDVAFQIFMSSKLPREELLVIQDAFNTQMSWLPEETVNPTNISLSRLPGNGKLRKAYKTLDGVAQRLLDGRRALPGEKPDDVLGAIIGATHPETGEPLSDERIKHEILSLLEAGHETTATLMGWSMLMMAKNPAEFKALQADVDQIAGEQAPGKAELKELDRADRVVKETLRMYPPFYLFMREATRDTSVGGVEVKAGTTLVSSLYEAHRDEDMWGAEKTGFPANEFHSDRFLERAEERFIPFGAGRRSCLGQVLGRLEGSLMLTRVAQEFDIVPAAPGPVELNSDLSLHPKDGEVTLRLRDR